jgi:hypothetical protein
MMRSSEPTRETRVHESNGQHAPGRRSVSVAACAVAGVAVMAAGLAPLTVVGALSFNHNETLLKRSARRRRRDRAIAGGVAVVAGTAVLAAAPVVPAVLGGMDLGNHNETLLVSHVKPRRVRRAAAAIAVAGTIGASIVAVGISTSPGARADRADSDGLELAVPINGTKGSSGGGPT